MKNKVKLKRQIILTLILEICLLIVFTGINIYEYNQYNINYNKKVDSIILKVKEKYPNITDSEIMEILNIYIL